MLSGGQIFNMLHHKAKFCSIGKASGSLAATQRWSWGEIIGAGGLISQLCTELLQLLHWITRGPAAWKHKQEPTRRGKSPEWAQLITFHRAGRQKQVFKKNRCFSCSSLGWLWAEGTRWQCCYLDAQPGASVCLERLLFWQKLWVYVSLIHECEICVNAFPSSLLLRDRCAELRSERMCCPLIHFSPLNTPGVNFPSNRQTQNKAAVKLDGWQERRWSARLLTAPVALLVISYFFFVQLFCVSALFIHIHRCCYRGEATH